MRKFLLLVAVLVAVFVAVVAVRPSTFRVTRSTVMAAPPGRAFEEVNDLRRWNQWSPWANIDPSAKETFDGSPGGVGSSLAWTGNKDIGEGKMTIVESRPNELVRIRLDFVRPFRATHWAEFTFRPQPDGTQVTWTMEGRNNFLSKCVSLFVDCDRMIGGFFEKGLVRLKRKAEAPPGT